MISTLHSNAARQNGAKSNGPASSDGKATSSQNARKHNFFTNTSLLPTEDQEGFQSLLADFTGEHQPETPTQARYVREMADADFRLQRVRYYASQIQWKVIQSLTESKSPNADSFEKLAEEGKSLPLLLRYERHFQRQFDSALRILLDLKKRAAEARRTQKNDNTNARLTALEYFMLNYGCEEEEPENATQQNEPSNPPATDPPDGVSR